MIYDRRIKIYGLRSRTVQLVRPQHERKYLWQ